MIPVETDLSDFSELPKAGKFSDAEAPAESRPSKTRKKREMEALQDLGEALVRLPGARIARLDIPQELRAAVADAQRFTKHEAKRRQLQYIGRLMRSIDVAPIQAAVDEVRGASVAANAHHHQLEHLREQFMADERVLGDIAAMHPTADLQHLRQLRRNALKEQAHGKPPKAYRALFRALRALDEGDEGHEFDEFHEADGSDGEATDE